MTFGLVQDFIHFAKANTRIKGESFMSTALSSIQRNFTKYIHIKSILR